jgi:hypothetical protein
MDEKYTYTEFMRKFFPNECVTCPECGERNAVLIGLCTCEFNHKIWKCDCGHSWNESDDQNSWEYLSTSHAPTILSAYGVIADDHQESEE